jgi:CMP-N-acetylneuraminic acid synthetase
MDDVSGCKSRYIDEIFVSSNDQKVEQNVCDFAKKHIDELQSKKINYIRRPSELCTATSKTEEAITHFSMNIYCYRNYNYFVLLQATSPARRNGLIDCCIESCIPEYASLITVEKHTPFFWRENEETQTTYPIYSLKNRPMRQELSESDFFQRQW